MTIIINGELYHYIDNIAIERVFEDEVRITLSGVEAPIPSKVGHFAVVADN